MTRGPLRSVGRYYCHLDDTMRRADRYERPELVNGTIDFIAPAEYMVRDGMRGLVMGGRRGWS